MTISSVVNKDQYNGNGTTTVFTYLFRIISVNDIIVVLTDANGVDTVQILNTDFTVTSVGNDGGGTVVFVTAPALGIRVTLTRNAQALQPEHYVENDPFPAASHEIALDRVTTVSQTVLEQTSRAIQVPYGTNAGTFNNLLPPLITANAGKSIIVKSDLSGFTYNDSVTGDVLGPVSSIDNAVVRWDGTTGKLIQNSNATISDTGNLALSGDVTITPNTAAGITLNASAGSASQIRFVEIGGVNYVAFRSAASLAVNTVYTLPTTDGLSGQVLSTDGSGNLSWINNAVPPPFNDTLASLSDVHFSALLPLNLFLTHNASTWSNFINGAFDGVEAFDTHISKTNVAETRSASINMADNVISQTYLLDYSETTQTVAAAITTTLDVANGNVFQLTHATDITTLIFSTPSTTCSEFTLIRVKDNSSTFRFIDAWPTSVKWHNNLPPTLTQTANAVDIFYFRTVNNGTVWFGLTVSNNLS